MPLFSFYVFGLPRLLPERECLFVLFFLLRRYQEIISDKSQLWAMFFQVNPNAPRLLRIFLIIVDCVDNQTSYIWSILSKCVLQQLYGISGRTSWHHVFGRGSFIHIIPKRKMTHINKYVSNMSAMANYIRKNTIVVLTATASTKYVTHEKN